MYRVCVYVVCCQLIKGQAQQLPARVAIVFKGNQFCKWIKIKIARLQKVKEGYMAVVQAYLSPRKLTAAVELSFWIYAGYLQVV